MLKSAVNGGVVLGLFLLLKFAVSILSLQIPLLEFFSLLMLAGVPYVLYRLQERFSTYSGVTAYRRIWSFGTATFLFSLFFLGAGQYVYCKYVNPNYLPMLFDMAIASFKSMNLGGDFIAEAQRQPLPTPAQYVFSMSFINLIIGWLLSAGTAAWVYKKKKQ